jgi:hypothetical protein
VFIIDVANALLTLAQVAIGLVGFSAILVALSGKPHQWTPVDAFRIRNILAFTFQSVFLSLTLRPEIDQAIRLTTRPQETTRMKAYLLVTATIFGLVGIAHLVRLFLEGHPRSDSWLLAR